MEPNSKVKSIRLVLTSLVVGSSSAEQFVSIPNQSCGINNQIDRVVGGFDASLGQFPWQARFSSCQSDTGGCALCGATLISDRWLTTAKHCVEGAFGFNARAESSYSAFDKQNSGESEKK